MRVSEATVRIWISAAWACVALCAVAVVPVDADPTLSAGDLTLSINERDGRVSALSERITGRERLGEARGGVHFIDGKTERKLVEGRADLRHADDQRIEFHWRDESGAVNAHHRLEAHADHITWQVELRNRGDEVQWLQPRLELALAFDSPARYWNGSYEITEIVGEFARSDAFGSLPLSFVRGDEAGLAIGLDPRQMLSYIEKGIASEDGRSVRPYYGTKLVIDPGDVERVTFVLYATETDYGYSNAVHAYHHMFRELFEPQPGTDPRLAGGSGIGLSSYRPAKQELLRRGFHGFSWWYAPIKRPGDWYGREQYWDWPEGEAIWKEQQKPRNRNYRDRFSQNVIFRREWPDGNSRGNILDHETFHRQRARFMLDSETYNNIPVMYYVINWADRDLAESNDWLDLHIRDERYTPNERSWVVSWSPPRSELHMFWGAGFAESTRRDMRQLADELNISGFAFDVASGGPRLHIDTKIDDIPGRAYDEHGPYYDSGVGIARMMQFVNELEVEPFWGGPYTAGVVAGFTNRRYYIPYHTTIAHIEMGDIGRPLVQPARYRAHRYMFGSKRVVKHGSQAAPRRLLHDEIDWREMTPEQIRETYRRVWDGMLLSYLELGIMPGGDLPFGVEKQMRYLPKISALNDVGWEALPAFRPDETFDHLRLSRYGRGIHAYLVAGNGGMEAIESEFTVDNRYIGEQMFLFTDYHGEAMEARLEEGRTILRATVPSREALILKAVLGVEGEAELDARVEEDASADGGQITASLSSDAPRQATLTARIPEHMRASRVLVNDREVAFEPASDGGIAFGAELDAGGNVVEVTYDSEIFHSAEEDLRDYPFVVDGAPNVTIVLPGDFHEKERLAAERIREYFNFWYGYHDPEFMQQMTQGPAQAQTDISIPILRDVEVGRDRASRGLVLIGGPERNELARQHAEAFPSAAHERGVAVDAEDDLLLVSGEDALDLNEILLAYFRVLDEAYPWIGHYTNAPTSGDTRDHLQKAEMYGAPLREAE